MPSPDRKRRLTAFLVAMAVLIATPLAVVATNAFTDVPESNVHHDNITWLEENGVTAGCNPPDNTEYCPGEPVLRQQMASFMRRLAENQVVDAATAQEANHATTADSAQTAEDADTLEGLNADDLIRVYGSLEDGDIDDFTETEFTEVASVTADAPVDGLLHIVGSISAEEDCSLPGVGNLEVRLTINGTPTHDNFGWELSYDECTGLPPIPGIGDSTTLTAVVPASAGSHTVELQAEEFGDGSFIFGRALSVVFSPFGQGTLIPASDGTSPSSNSNRQ